MGAFSRRQCSVVVVLKYSVKTVALNHSYECQPLSVTGLVAIFLYDL